MFSNKFTSKYGSIVLVCIRDSQNSRVLRAKSKTAGFNANFDLSNVRSETTVFLSLQPVAKTKVRWKILYMLTCSVNLAIITQRKEGGKNSKCNQRPDCNRLHTFMVKLNE